MNILRLAFSVNQRCTRGTIFRDTATIMNPIDGQPSYSSVVRAKRLDMPARGQLVEPRAKPPVLRRFDKLKVVPSLVEGRQAQDERVSWRIAIVFLSTILTSSCGSNSPSAPSVAQAAGAWVGNSTLTAVSGGECVGSTLQAAIGSRDIFTAALKQAGSMLDATVTSQGNGTSCAYTGTSGGSVIGLTMAACQADRVLRVRCGNGALRDLQMQADGITANVDVRTGSTGTDVSAWTVFVSGTAVPVGLLTLTANFTWTFLGLPAADYHVFTGTIFPGYADGTISIEGTDAFCAPCGWFPH